MDAAQDAAHSIEETLEDVVQQRPLATVALALGLGFLIGATWRRNNGRFLRDRWSIKLAERRRRCAAISFGRDIFFESRRSMFAADDR